MKWSVRADVNKCREALEKYGLPITVAHRQDKNQFRSPESTERFDDKLWDAVADAYESGIKEQQVLPLSAYQNIFGHKHSTGLSKDEFRHVQDVYRWYCQKVSAIAEMKDEGARADNMADLFEVLRAWGPGLSDAHLVCAWQICHSQSSKNNRAVFVFEVFGDRLLELLAKVYGSEEITRLNAQSDQPEFTREQYMALQSGLRGKLIPTGAPLAIQTPTEQEEQGKAPKATPTDLNLKTIALVSLKDITPDQLAEAVKDGRAVAKVDEKRPLPAQGNGAFGVSIWHEDKEVAIVADKDIPVFHELGGLVGEPITYSRSLKLVTCQA